VHPYLALTLAIASELAGTTALKYSDGFTNPLPSAVVIVGYLGAFYLLSLTLQDLDLGLVYATWAAAGVVGSVAIGVALFEESLDLAGVVGVVPRCRRRRRPQRLLRGVHAGALTSRRRRPTGYSRRSRTKTGEREETGSGGFGMDHVVARGTLREGRLTVGRLVLDQESMRWHGLTALGHVPAADGDVDTEITSLEDWSVLYDWGTFVALHQ